MAPYENMGHNAFHGERGRVREFVVVFGPPLSGKSTYIREHADPGTDAALFNRDRIADPHGARERLRQGVVERMYGTGRVWVEDDHPAVSRTLRYCGVPSDRIMTVQVHATFGECIDRARDARLPFECYEAAIRAWFNRYGRR